MYYVELGSVSVNAHTFSETKRDEKKNTYRMTKLVLRDDKLTVLIKLAKTSLSSVGGRI